MGVLKLESFKELQTNAIFIYVQTDSQKLSHFSEKNLEQIPRNPCHSTKSSLSSTFPDHSQSFLPRFWVSPANIVYSILVKGVFPIHKLGLGLKNKNCRPIQPEAIL